MLQALCVGFKMCQDDSDKLALLAKLQDLGPQLLKAVPEDQQQWLLASFWNRGCSHIKFGRPIQAVQLMQAALQVQSWHTRDADQQQVLSKPGSAYSAPLHMLPRCCSQILKGLPISDVSDGEVTCLDRLWHITVYKLQLNSTELEPRTQPPTAQTTCN